MVIAACSFDGESKPRARASATAPAVAVAVVSRGSLPEVLAIDGPAEKPTPGVQAGRFGVRWRATIPGITPGIDDTEGTVVIGNEVFVSTPGEIQVFDLATGARARSAKLDHTQLVAAGGALVARNDREEIGLDVKTLQPTWHAPAPNYLGVVGEYVLETPPLSQRQVLRLRRAADGRVMWENGERLFAAAGTSPQLDGDTLYVQAYVGVDSRHCAALDIATGAVRWRADGYLRSASGGHVVVQDADGLPPSIRILDTKGNVKWRAGGAWVWLRGDQAYASTQDTVTAIDLPSNRVLWRRSGVSADEGDDRWIYGRTASDKLVVIDRASGDLVGEMQLGSVRADRLVHGAPVIRIGNWLFALGPRSTPEPRTPVVARGCLVVMGCPGNSYTPAGAKVTIDGTTIATTDRRGCFQARAELGLAPARVEITSATGRPLELDNGFPEAVVFGDTPVTMQALYIGGGCHDSRPGQFP